MAENGDLTDGWELRPCPDCERRQRAFRYSWGWRFVDHICKGARYASGIEEQA